MKIKSKKTVLLSFAALTCALTGICASAQEALTEAVSEAYEENYAAESVDWNTFIVENPEQYVTLGEYRGLDVEKSVYAVTEEDVQIELDNRLYATAVMEDTGRPAQTGDTVLADITSTVNGEAVTDEDYPIDLGYEQFGPAFDEKLMGCSAGDTLEFTLTFDEDTDMEDWAGQTVDFKVDVHSVQVLNQPEFDEAWVTENSDFEDTESYLEALKTELQANMDRQNEDTAASSAFALAMQNAEFNGYPQELFDVTHAQVYSQFEMLADMFGITVDELYESYDMSEEDLLDETLDQVNSYLFLSAIAKEEGIEVTDEDIKAFADEAAVSYGYDSAQTMLDESDPAELKLAVLNHKVSYFILGLSNVTETAYNASEEDLIFDDSSAVDDWEDDEYYDEEGYDEADAYDDYAEYDEYDESYDEYDENADFGWEDDGTDE